MDNKSFAIGVLTVTAAILLTALLLVGGEHSGPAYADVTSRAGDYVMATGFTTKTEEILFVIDGSTHQLNAYRLVNNRQLNRDASLDLNRAFRGR